MTRSLWFSLGGADKQAGLKKIKAGLESHLNHIKFDDQAETKGGAVVITGTGTGKKASVEVVFAAAGFVPQ